MRRNKIDSNTLRDWLREGKSVVDVCVREHVKSPRKCDDCHVIGHDIRIRYVVFEGDLDLSSLEIKGTLRLEHVFVGGRLILHGIRVRDNLVMDDVAVCARDKVKHKGAIDLNGTKIGGLCDLKRLRVDGGIMAEATHAQSLVMNEIYAASEVSFSHALINGSVSIEKITIRSPKLNQESREEAHENNKGCNLVLRGINAKDDITISGGDIAGCVSVNNCSAEGNIVLKVGSGDNGGHLVVGRLTAVGAHVGGRFELSGAQVLRDAKLNSIKIEAGLSMCPSGSYRPSIGGDLVLSGCDMGSSHIRAKGLFVGGSFTMRSAVSGPVELAIGRMERPSTTKGQQKSDAGERNGEGSSIEFIPCSVGRVMISNCKINGWLSMPFIQVAGTSDRFEKRGVSIEQSVIKGDILFWMDWIFRDLERDWHRRYEKPLPDRGIPSAWEHRAVIVGAIEIINTQIGGECQFTRVAVEEGIVLRDSQVKGDVLFRSVASALNWPDTHKKDKDDLIEKFSKADRREINAYADYIDLEMLRCDGDVDLTGLELNEPAKHDDASREAGGKHLTGHVLARQLHVDGEIMLFARFECSKGCKGYQGSPIESHAGVPGALDLTSARAHRLVFSRMSFFNERSADPCEDGVILAHGRFHAIEIPLPAKDADIMSFERKLPKPLNLTDCEVGSWKLANDGAPNVSAFVALLNNNCPGKIRRSTYRAVEDYLINRGHDRDSEKIYRAMQKRAYLEKRKNAFWLKPWLLLKNSFFKVLGDYGTRPVQLFVYIIMIWILSMPVYKSSLNIEPSLAYLSVNPSFINDKGSLPVKDRLPARGDLDRANEVNDTEPLPVKDQAPEEWRWGDAFFVSWRYHVPIIPIGGREEWQLRDHIIMVHEGECDKRFKFTLGIQYDKPCPSVDKLRFSVNIPQLTPEGYGIIVYALNWVLWPIFLMLVARRLIRSSGRSQ